MPTEKLYFAIVGGGMVLLGLFLLSRRIALSITGTTTQGRLVDWEKRGRKATYHPVIEFIDTDGATQRVTGLFGYGKKPNLAHRTFQVIYPERQPSKALVYSFLHFWAGPVAFILFSIPLFWLLFSR